MSARLDFVVGYIGSAALVAFLATCLNSPRVATFACDTPPGKSKEHCELVETLAVSASTSDDASARNTHANESNPAPAPSRVN